MSNLFVPIKTAALTWQNELPYSLDFEDVYFPKEGGIEQSQHVFVAGNNLIARWQELSQIEHSQFTIAETGFGTGLNFLIVWQLWEQYAPKTSTLHFISCDNHPLHKDDLCRSLARWPQLKVYADKLINEYPILTPGYHQLSFFDGRIKLTLMLGDAYECYEQLLICGEQHLESILRKSFVDAWFLDGFAPKKNQSIWSEALFRTIALLSKQDTTLATFTAARPVKSLLAQYGFAIEKLKGYGPKRHMIKGVYSPKNISEIKGRHTPWQINPPHKITPKKAIIVGAGLAGCFTAHNLAKRGWKVYLIDEQASIANGASANSQAVLFPKLSAYRSPFTQFMLSSFLYAQTVYRPLLKKNPLGELNGSFLHAHNLREKNAQLSLQDWLTIYPELGVLLDSNQASIKLGIPFQESGLFIPLSGWINMPALCGYLIQDDNIELITNQKVERLEFCNSHWVIGNIQAPVTVLCNGYAAHNFVQSEHLPLKPIRGQMTTILANQETLKLKIPLCGDGHVLPAREEMHQLGATYGLGDASCMIKSSDNQDNITKIKRLAPALHWADEQIIDQWVGVRASTPDYLPLVGPVAQANLFTETFKGLGANSRRWIPSAGNYYPGLYVCAGYGSRGLTTIPLSAEYLAGLISQEMPCLPRQLIQAIAPARFLRKAILRGTN